MPAFDSVSQLWYRGGAEEEATEIITSNRDISGASRRSHPEWQGPSAADGDVEIPEGDDLLVWIRDYDSLNLQHILPPLAGHRLRGVDFTLTMITPKDLDTFSEFAAASFPELDALNVSYCGSLGSSGLAHLSLPGLRALGYASQDQLFAHRDALRPLGEFSAMEVLDLSHNRLWDEALPVLGSLERLRNLELSHTQVTDAGLQPVLWGCEGIKELGLAHTAITNGGVEDALKAFASLEYLDASFTSTDDGAFAALDDLPPRQLRFLGVSGTGIDDAGIELLVRNCPNLEWLALLHTRVTERGLLRLLDLPRLRRIQLWGVPESWLEPLKARGIQFG